MGEVQASASNQESKASRKQVIANSRMCKNNGKITANKRFFLRLL